MDKRTPNRFKAICTEADSRMVASEHTGAKSTWKTVLAFLELTESRWVGGARPTNTSEVQIEHTHTSLNRPDQSIHRTTTDGGLSFDSPF